MRGVGVRSLLPEGEGSRPETQQLEQEEWSGQWGSWQGVSWAVVGPRPAMLGVKTCR